jgi:hypothetical protein
LTDVGARENVQPVKSYITQAVARAGELVRSDLQSPSARKDESDPRPLTANSDSVQVDALTDSKGGKTKAGGVHDRPTHLDDEDAFSHRDYAIAAAESLLAADTSFTLGLFGDWGIGKTTIVRQIGKIVRDKKLGFVEFDVWRFEGDALRRQFLREVAQQLKLQKHLPWSYRPDRELRDLEVDIPVVTDRLRFSWWALLRSVIVGASLGLLAWWYLQSGLPDKMFGRKADATTAQEAAFLLSGLTFLYSLLSQIFMVDRRTVTVQRIEEPERFYQKFVELLQRAKAGRVVIAIDNLDRCSPGLVDTMLATIKTYLEPAQQDSAIPPIRWRDRLRRRLQISRNTGPTDAVFVIAADDAGVRRHMVAREIEKLPRLRDDASRDKATLDEAERVVDEYLRKFFDASIRLRPILQEDIREYAGRELARVLVYAQEIEGKTSGDPEMVPGTVQERLVSLVVSALRRNPRRIKQFGNSLETRLRTIRAREASGGIAGREKVSQDLLGIAKLAILEEEWREFYRELESNPRRLAQAQKEVGEADMEDPRLSTFLRDTRDIVPANVSAVVNLKLESVELGLPEFAEYREAVAYGDFEVAARIVSDAEPAVADQYSRRLPELFSRELSQRAMSEARNILRAALEPKPLGLDDPPEIKRMLADAANDPVLVVQLSLLPPGPVFAAMNLLSPDDRARARAPFIDLAQVGEQLGASGVREVATELAQVVNELSPRERRELESPLQVEPTASQYRSSFLPLLTADPTFVSDGIIQASWQVLNSRFDVTTPEFDVMTLGFSAGRGEALVAEFLQKLSGALVEAVPLPPIHTTVFRGVVTALERMSAPDDAELATLVGTVSAHVPSLVAAEPESASAFALEAAALARRFNDAAPQTSAAGDQLIAVTCQNAPLQVAAHLVDRDIAIDFETRELTTQQLEALLPSYTEPGQRVALLRGILTAEDGPQRARTILATYFSETEMGNLRPVLVPVWSELGNEGAGLIEDLYGFSRSAASATQRAAIETIIAVVAAGHMAPAEFLAVHWEEISAARRASLRKALVDLLDTDLSYLEPVAGIAQSVQLRAVDRESFVRAFLRGARVATDATERSRAVEIAKALAKSSKPATQLVTEALKTLDAEG